MSPLPVNQPVAETEAAKSRVLHPPKVAYFTMEVALHPDVPTYSGGLGVLAGDTIRSAADLGVSMQGMSLLYRRGYFNQSLDSSGKQTENPVEWDPKDRLEPMDPLVTVTLSGRPVHIRCWRYPVYGVNGHLVPVYFLDTDVSTNSAWDRKITGSLYGGDEYYRLCQEFILGVGGLQMLRQLGHTDVETYHMNEGHSALLVLRLLERQLASSDRQFPGEDDLAALRKKCVFTTHTPVPAGHDSFPEEMVRRVLGDDRTTLLFSTGFSGSNELNMTRLALHHSNYVNGVAMKHGEVSRRMFPKYRIKALTNGVHATTWLSRPMQEVLDREIPEWRHDNIYLRYAINVSLKEVREAHAQAKRTLLSALLDATGEQLEEDVFTIGFARRATGYKRADLFFRDSKRLEQIVKKAGKLQIVYGGKAHPRDSGGKDLIRRVFAAADRLSASIKIIYVENYDITWGAMICSGVDLWLNTPEKEREASGTSGMKAAMNGVPSLSVLDGWWLEGHIEGVTGWSIEDNGDGEAGEAASLYDKLERIILPMYYDDPDAYAKVMRSAIALNGTFFNTQRMVMQYVFNAYSRTNGG